MLKFVRIQWGKKHFLFKFKMGTTESGSLLHSCDLNAFLLKWKINIKNICDAKKKERKSQFFNRKH